MRRARVMAMWVFGFLCLISAAAALPAPQSSEIAPPEAGPFTNISEDTKKSKENQEGIESSPTTPKPPQPELKKENKTGSSEGKSKEEDKSIKEKENESGGANKEEDKKPIVVNLDVNKPSCFANLFPNFPFSWPPKFPFSLPNFNFPSFPFYGEGQRARLVYNPNYYKCTRNILHCRRFYI